MGSELSATAAICSLARSCWLPRGVPALDEQLRGPQRLSLRPLQRGPLSLSPQWMHNVLGQVLDALEFLHRLNIVHR